MVTLLTSDPYATPTPVLGFKGYFWQMYPFPISFFFIKKYNFPETLAEFPKVFYNTDKGLQKGVSQMIDETKGLDLRKWKSREALKRSFWQLLEEVGYDKINVRSIAAASELNPKTFYRNYENMDALRDDALLDLFSLVSSPFSTFGAPDAVIGPDLFEECTRAYIEIVKEEQNRLRLVFDNHLEGFAQNVWKQLYTITAPDYVILGPNASPVLSDPDALDLYSNYTAFGTWAHLEWTLRHVDFSMEELLPRTMDAYSAYLYNYYVGYRIGDRFRMPETTH